MIEPRSHSLMPFHPIKGTEATLADIQTFLDGAVDTDLVLAYAQPLMALRWKTLKVSIDHPRVDVGAMVLFSLFRLMHQPASIPMITRNDIDVPPDLSILTRLASGDLVTAAQTAKRRLYGHGIGCHVREVVGQRELARLLAAAMIFPVRQRDIGSMIKRLTKPTLEPTNAFNQQELS